MSLGVEEDDDAIGWGGNKFADLFAQHMAPTEESKIQIERKYLGRH